MKSVPNFTIEKAILVVFGVHIYALCDQNETVSFPKEKPLIVHCAYSLLGWTNSCKGLFGTQVLIEVKGGYPPVSFTSDRP